MRNRLCNLFFVFFLLFFLPGCGGGGGGGNQNLPAAPTPSSPPADTYFSLAVTENSHNHTGARLLFLDFQDETANPAVIQNNVVISPKVAAGTVTLNGNASDWAPALLTTVNGLVQNNYPLSEFIDAVPTDIKVGSAWDDNYIYFLVQWEDAGHTRSTKYRKWFYGDQGNGESGWNARLHLGVTSGAPNELTANAGHPLAGAENEDHVLMMFPIVDSENNFSDGKLGCAAFCHTNLKKGSPSQNYTGLGMVAMHTNVTNDTADIWHWKSSRTAASNNADDKYLVYANGSNNGRRSDNGSAAYSENPLSGGNPQSMHSSGLSYIGNVLLQTDVVPFSGPASQGHQLPAIINTVPDSSRGDVDAWASFSGAPDYRWTVEFRRMRNTGNNDDHQFITGTDAPPPSSPAVSTTNAASGEALYNSHCQSCHQTNGSGTIVGASWGIPRIQRASGSLILKALQTITPMQGISLNQQEVEDIAAFLQTQASFSATRKLSVYLNGISGNSIISSNPSGIDCPGTCSFDFVENGVIALSAAYVAGYTFDGWSGACDGNQGCDVTLSTDQAVSATYSTNITNYTLTVTRSGNGVVTSSPAGIDCGSICSKTYTAGTNITLTATPAAGYQFDGWSGAGCSGTGTCVFNHNADITVTADFSLKPVTDCGTGVIYDQGGTNGYGRELVVNDNSISQPTDIAFIPGMTDAFLVVSQRGAVYFFNGGCDPVNSIVLNDIGIDVITGGEQGLLNVEFHPDYNSNSYVFFYHTSVNNNTNSVSRASLSLDNSGNMVLSDPVRIIDFRKNTGASNHDGGGLVFAPDGTLLASVGDGGSGGSANGQNSNNLLGVVVRIIPSLASGAGGYNIPTSGNMFPATNTKCSGTASSPAPCPEILAMGLRNPFRMSMAGNIVYLGDVGARYEEINSFDYTSVDTSSPVNFGWSTHDGYTSSSTITGYRNPIVYYERNDTVANNFRAEDPEGRKTGSASIIVGDIHSGSQYSGELGNKLFFADFYDGYMRAVGVDGNGRITDVDGIPGMHVIHHDQITSMVEAPDSYMYITTLYGPAMVYRIVKP